MATRTHSGTWISRGAHETTWTGLLNGDNGDAVDTSGLPIKTVHVYGTFGTGGSISIEGSNDGSNYHVLTDPQGIALTFTAAAIERVSENPRYIRPRVTAGDGTTNLSVKLVSVAAR